jgi:hypothetical protein
MRSGRAVLFAILVAFVSLAWQPGLSAPYQYDDTVTPVNDPASQSLSAWASALPRTLRPLTKLTYAIESSLGATSAPARRVFNGVVFLLAGAVLALLARELGVRLELAAVLAALWACHPVHAETLLALAGRSVLIALALMLSSALFFLRRRDPSALACAVLAVLARETAVLWLLACAGLVAWRRGLPRARLVAALAAAGALGVALVLGSARMRALLEFSFGDPGAYNRLGLQWAALPRGIVLWIFDPGAFSVDMEFALRGAERLIYIALALLMYACAATLVFRRGSSLGVRVSALLWLCFIVPVHSVVPKLDPLTARSVSASSAALVALFAAAFAGVPARNSKTILAAALAMIALLSQLCVLARERAGLYRDPIALWRDAATRSRESTRPWINLGTLLAQSGELEGARAAFREALRRNVHSTEARERLAATEVLMDTRKLLTAPSTRDTFGRDERVPH